MRSDDGRADSKRHDRCLGGLSAVERASSEALEWKCIPVVFDMVSDRVSSRFLTVALWAVVILFALRGLFGILALSTPNISVISPKDTVVLRQTSQNPAAEVGRSFSPPVSAIRTSGDLGEGVFNASMVCSLSLPASAGLLDVEWGFAGTDIAAYGILPEASSSATAARFSLPGFVPEVYKTPILQGASVTTGSDGLALFSRTRPVVALPSTYEVSVVGADDPAVAAAGQQVVITSAVASVSVDASDAAAAEGRDWLVGDVLPRVRATVRNAAGRPLANKVCVALNAPRSRSELEALLARTDPLSPRHALLEGFVSSPSAQDGVVSFSRLRIVSSSVRSVLVRIVCDGVAGEGRSQGSDLQLQLADVPTRVEVVRQPSPVVREGGILARQPRVRVLIRNCSRTLWQRGTALPRCVTAAERSAVPWQAVPGAVAFAFIGGKNGASFQIPVNEDQAEELLYVGGGEALANSIGRAKAVTGFRSAPANASGVASFASLGFIQHGPAGAYQVGFAYGGSSARSDWVNVTSSVATVVAVKPLATDNEIVEAIRLDATTRSHDVQALRAWAGAAGAVPGAGDPVVLCNAGYAPCVNRPDRSLGMAYGSVFYEHTFAEALAPCVSATVEQIIQSLRSGNADVPRLPSGALPFGPGVLVLDAAGRPLAGKLVDATAVAVPARPGMALSAANATALPALRLAEFPGRGYTRSGVSGLARFFRSGADTLTPNQRMARFTSTGDAGSFFRLVTTAAPGVPAVPQGQTLALALEVEGVRGSELVPLNVSLDEPEPHRSKCAFVEIVSTPREAVVQRGPAPLGFVVRAIDLHGRPVPNQPIQMHSVAALGATVLVGSEARGFAERNVSIAETAAQGRTSLFQNDQASYSATKLLGGMAAYAIGDELTSWLAGAGAEGLMPPLDSVTTDADGYAVFPSASIVEVTRAAFMRFGFVGLTSSTPPAGRAKVPLAVPQLEGVQGAHWVLQAEAACVSQISEAVPLRSVVARSNWVAGPDPSVPLPTGRGAAIEPAFEVEYESDDGSAITAINGVPIEAMMLAAVDRDLTLLPASVFAGTLPFGSLRFGWHLQPGYYTAPGGVFWSMQGAATDDWLPPFDLFTGDPAYPIRNYLTSVGSPTRQGDFRERFMQLNGVRTGEGMFNRFINPIMGALPNMLESRGTRPYPVEVREGNPARFDALNMLRGFAGTYSFVVSTSGRNTEPYPPLTFVETNVTALRVAEHRQFHLSLGSPEQTTSNGWPGGLAYQVPDCPTPIVGFPAVTDCPNGCNGPSRGVCVCGLCVCRPGWDGAADCGARVNSEDAATSLRFGTDPAFGGMPVVDLAIALTVAGRLLYDTNVDEPFPRVLLGAVIQPGRYVPAAQAARLRRELRDASPAGQSPERPTGQVPAEVRPHDDRDKSRASRSASLAPAGEGSPSTYQRVMARLDSLRRESAELLRAGASSGVPGGDVAAVGEVERAAARAVDEMLQTLVDGDEADVVALVNDSAVLQGGAAVRASRLQMALKALEAREADMQGKPAGEGWDADARAENPGSSRSTAAIGESALARYPPWVDAGDSRPGQPDCSRLQAGAKDADGCPASSLPVAGRRSLASQGLEFVPVDGIDGRYPAAPVLVDCDTSQPVPDAFFVGWGGDVLRVVDPSTALTPTDIDLDRCSDVPISVSTSHIEWSRGLSTTDFFRGLARVDRRLKLRAPPGCYRIVWAFGLNGGGRAGSPENRQVAPDLSRAVAVSQPTRPFRVLGPVHSIAVGAGRGNEPLITVPRGVTVPLAFEANLQVRLPLNFTSLEDRCVGEEVDRCDLASALVFRRPADEVSRCPTKPVRGLIVNVEARDAVTGAVFPLYSRSRAEASLHSDCALAAAQSSSTYRAVFRNIVFPTDTDAPDVPDGDYVLAFRAYGVTQVFGDVTIRLRRDPASLVLLNSTNGALSGRVGTALRPPVRARAETAALASAAQGLGVPGAVVVAELLRAPFNSNAALDATTASKLTGAAGEAAWPALRFSAGKPGRYEVQVRAKLTASSADSSTAEASGELAKVVLVDLLPSTAGVVVRNAGGFAPAVVEGGLLVGAGASDTAVSTQNQQQSQAALSAEELPRICVVPLPGSRPVAGQTLVASLYRRQAPLTESDCRINGVNASLGGASMETYPWKAWQIAAARSLPVRCLDPSLGFFLPPQARPTGVIDTRQRVSADFSVGTLRTGADGCASIRADWTLVRLAVSGEAELVFRVVAGAQPGDESDPVAMTLTTREDQQAKVIQSASDTLTGATVLPALLIAPALWANAQYTSGLCRALTWVASVSATAVLGFFAVAENQRATADARLLYPPNETILLEVFDWALVGVFVWVVVLLLMILWDGMRPLVSLGCAPLHLQLGTGGAALASRCSCCRCGWCFGGVARRASRGVQDSKAASAAPGTVRGCGACTVRLLTCSCDGRAAVCGFACLGCAPAGGSGKLGPRKAARHPLVPAASSAAPSGYYAQKLAAALAYTQARSPRLIAPLVRVTGRLTPEFTEVLADVFARFATPVWTDAAEQSGPVRVGGRPAAKESIVAVAPSGRPWCGPDGFFWCPAGCRCRPCALLGCDCGVDCGSLCCVNRVTEEPCACCVSARVVLSVGRPDAALVGLRGDSGPQCPALCWDRILPAWIRKTECFGTLIVPILGCSREVRLRMVLTPTDIDRLRSWLLRLHTGIDCTHPGGCEATGGGWTVNAQSGAAGGGAAGGDVAAGGAASGAAGSADSADASAAHGRPEGAGGSAAGTSSSSPKEGGFGSTPSPDREALNALLCAPLSTEGAVQILEHRAATMAPLTVLGDLRRVCKPLAMALAVSHAEGELTMPDPRVLFVQASGEQPPRFSEAGRQFVEAELLSRLRRLEAVRGRTLTLGGFVSVMFGHPALATGAPASAQRTLFSQELWLWQRLWCADGADGAVLWVPQQLTFADFQGMMGARLRPMRTPSDPRPVVSSNATVSGDAAAFVGSFMMSLRGGAKPFVADDVVWAEIREWGFDRLLRMRFTRGSIDDAASKLPRASQSAPRAHRSAPDSSSKGAGSGSLSLSAVDLDGEDKPSAGAAAGAEGAAAAASRYRSALPRGPGSSSSASTSSSRHCGAGATPAAIRGARSAAFGVYGPVYAFLAEEFRVVQVRFREEPEAADGQPGAGHPSPGNAAEGAAVTRASSSATDRQGAIVTTDAGSPTLSWSQLNRWRRSVLNSPALRRRMFREAALKFGSPGGADGDQDPRIGPVGYAYLLSLRFADDADAEIATLLRHSGWSERLCHVRTRELSRDIGTEALLRAIGASQGQLTASSGFTPRASLATLVQSGSSELHGHVAVTGACPQLRMRVQDLCSQLCSLAVTAEDDEDADEEAADKWRGQDGDHYSIATGLPATGAPAGKGSGAAASRGRAALLVSTTNPVPSSRRAPASRDAGGSQVGAGGGGGPWAGPGFAGSSVIPEAPATRAARSSHGSVAGNGALASIAALSGGADAGTRDGREAGRPKADDYGDGDAAAGAREARPAMLRRRRLDRPWTDALYIRERRMGNLESAFRAQRDASPFMYNQRLLVSLALCAVFCIAAAVVANLSTAQLRADLDRRFDDLVDSRLRGLAEQADLAQSASARMQAAAASAIALATGPGATIAVEDAVASALDLAASSGADVSAAFQQGCAASAQVPSSVGGISSQTIADASARATQEVALAGAAAGAAIAGATDAGTQASEDASQAASGVEGAEGAAAAGGGAAGAAVTEAGLLASGAAADLQSQALGFIDAAANDATLQTARANEALGLATATRNEVCAIEPSSGTVFSGLDSAVAASSSMLEELGVADAAQRFVQSSDLLARAQTALGQSGIDTEGLAQLSSEASSFLLSVDLDGLAATKDAILDAALTASNVAIVIAAIVVVLNAVLMLRSYRWLFRQAIRGEYRLVWNKNKVGKVSTFMGIAGASALLTFLGVWLIMTLVMFIFLYEPVLLVLWNLLLNVLSALIGLTLIITIAQTVIMQFVFAIGTRIRCRRLFMLGDFVMSLLGVFSALAVVAIRLGVAVGVLFLNFMRLDQPLVQRDMEHIDPATAGFNAVLILDVLGSHPVLLAFSEVLAVRLDTMRTGRRSSRLQATADKQAERNGRAFTKQSLHRMLWLAVFLEHGPQWLRAQRDHDDGSDDLKDEGFLAKALARAASKQ